MRKLLAASFVTLALAAPARADIPPPPGYVEQCTVEKQCKKGEDADACETYFSKRDKCQKLHASDGFQFRCRTGGASVWTEVWCRPKAKKGSDKK